MNVIGLSQTSREILEDGDVPIYLVVLITPDSLQLTVIVPVSYYTPSARRFAQMLVQYIYDRTFSTSVWQWIGYPLVGDFTLINWRKEWKYKVNVNYFNMVLNVIDSKYQWRKP